MEFVLSRSDPNKNKNWGMVIGHTKHVLHKIDFASNEIGFYLCFYRFIYCIFYCKVYSM